MTSLGRLSIMKKDRQSAATANSFGREKHFSSRHKNRTQILRRANYSQSSTPIITAPNKPKWKAKIIIAAVVDRQEDLKWRGNRRPLSHRRPG